MVTTVTMNPCIDLTLELADFQKGRLNLVEHARTDVSGKGINVSMVLRAFGLSTMCTGISFDGNGQRLADMLDANCIAHDFAIAHGDIRTNIKVLDTQNREMTEINSRGEPVPPAVLREALEKVAQYAKKSTVLVVSGRLPNGADDTLYKQCVQAAQGLPVKVIVDAEREPLRQAIEAGVYLIKPNVYELEQTFGCKLNTRGDVLAAARELVARGVELVCVSMGGDGALITDAREAWYAPALELQVRGFQGAGDSMVAGICRAMHEGLGIEGMLAYGVAAASGSLVNEGTLLCRAADFDRMLRAVRVERLRKEK